MPSIYMKKEKLLGILLKNRERHVKIYTATAKVFKKSYVKRLKEMLKKGLKDVFETYVNLTPPVNNKSSYDQAIRMTKLSSREEILLNDQEFRHFVMDKWGWTSTFIHSIYSNWSSTSSSSSSSLSSLSSSMPATIKTYIAEMERDEEYVD